MPNYTNKSKSVKNDETQAAVEANTTTVSKVNTTNAVAENEMLKMKLAQMEEQIAMLIALNNRAETVKDDNRNILFINLKPGTVVLKGTHSYHTMAGQFAKQSFPKHEAQSIVMNTPNLISSGIVYIADADFIKENHLEYTFHNILNETELKELLFHSPAEVLSIYNTVPQGQKDIIVSMIVEKKMNGEFVDANILFELSKICGKDLTDIDSIKDNK